MEYEEIITMLVLGLLIFVIAFSIIVSIVKFIINGFRTKDDIAIENMMVKEMQKVFPNYKK